MSVQDSPIGRDAGAYVGRRSLWQLTRFSGRIVIDLNKGLEMSFTPKLFLAVGLASLLAGCWPQDSNAPQKNQVAQSQANEGQGMMGQRQGRIGRGGGLRRACADEIQKFCSVDKRKFSCLQDNSDRLGQMCKTALNAAIQRRAERAGNNQQTNGNQQQ